MRGMNLGHVSSFNLVEKHEANHEVCMDAGLGDLARYRLRDGISKFRSRG
jgi:hypothetical protein